nr:hypothetical protein [Tanacetum cinerariifolium]
MRIKEMDSWVWGQGNMGWSGDRFGTVPVVYGAQEIGPSGFLRLTIGFSVLGVWDNYRIGPCHFFGLSPSGKLWKKAQLVPGVLSLTFNGFGFDLWAEIVPELDSLINRASM